MKIAPATNSQLAGGATEKNRVEPSSCTCITACVRKVLPLLSSAVDESSQQRDGVRWGGGPGWEAVGPQVGGAGTLRCLLLGDFSELPS